MGEMAGCRVRACGGLVWRVWEHDSIVFHVPSGNTHCLDVVAAAGLRCLEGAPLGADELAERMAAQLGVEVDDELRTYAAQLVRRFIEAGLVESGADA